jgi:hypothetical protein
LTCDPCLELPGEGRYRFSSLTWSERSARADADPSHTRTLPTAELKTLLEQAGARVFHETFHDQRLAVERWLTQPATPPEMADAIRRELRRELEDGAATGMRPLIQDGELRLTHRYAIVVARKGDGGE